VFDDVCDIDCHVLTEGSKIDRHSNVDRVACSGAS
jgi:hypothetical protein